VELSQDGHTFASAGAGTAFDRVYMAVHSMGLGPWSRTPLRGHTAQLRHCLHPVPLEKSSLHVRLCIGIH
jgi:hypothetical protein